jgi:hypothetical protein
LTTASLLKHNDYEATVKPHWLQAVGMYFVTGGDLDYWKSALQEPVPVSTGSGRCVECEEPSDIFS